VGGSIAIELMLNMEVSALVFCKGEKLVNP